MILQLIDKIDSISFQTITQLISNITTLTIDEKSQSIPFINKIEGIGILCVFILVGVYVFNFFNKKGKTDEAKRYSIGIFLVLLLLGLCSRGQNFIYKDFYSNCVTMVIEIIFTLFVIDRINVWQIEKGKKAFRKLSATASKQIILNYCRIWIEIYELAYDKYKQVKGGKANEIEGKGIGSIICFFKEDIFYETLAYFPLRENWHEYNITNPKHFLELINDSKNQFNSHLIRFVGKFDDDAYYENLLYFCDNREITLFFKEASLLSNCVNTTKDLPDNTSYVTSQSSSLVNKYKDNIKVQFEKLERLVDAYNNEVKLDKDKLSFKYVYNNGVVKFV